MFNNVLNAVLRKTIALCSQICFTERARLRPSRSLIRRGRPTPFRLFVVSHTASDLVLSMTGCFSINSHDSSTRTDNQHLRVRDASSHNNLSKSIVSVVSPIFGTIVAKMVPHFFLAFLTAPRARNVTRQHSIPRWAVFVMFSLIIVFPYYYCKCIDLFFIKGQ